MSLMKSVSLPMGWEAKDFKLMGVDDKEHSLADFKDKQGLLIVFSCNHCPFAKKQWSKLVKLDDEFGKEIGMIVINSNDPNMYPEDGLEGMKELVKKYGVKFPYVVDKTQEIAKTYQAQCTPDSYLFKNEKSGFKLYYHGKDLKQGMKGLLEGEPVLEKQKPSMGCSIKWK